MPSTVRSGRSILFVVVLVVACGGSPASPVVSSPSPSAPVVSAAPATSATPVPSPSADAWLVVRRAGEDRLRVVLASTLERIYDLPLGVPDEDWGTLISATPLDGRTTVRREVVQPGSGGLKRVVDGAWRLPTIGLDPMPVGVSPDGSTIVLVEDAPADAAVSRFAILGWRLDTDPRIITLDGTFEYDTLSPDGSILYVVQHLPGPPDGHYQVRAIDLATGVLRDGAVVDKLGSDEAMAGYPLAQARRPNGMVLTLYRGAEHPFIHALSSVDAWALCIDLPAEGHDDAAAARDWGLIGSPDDASTLAVNATLGLAIRVADGDLSVNASTTFEPSAAMGIRLAKFGHQPSGPVARRVVAAPDGNSVYATGPGGIVRLSADDLQVTGRFLEGSAVDAIAVTADGATIYALLSAGGRIAKVDAATGAVLGYVPSDGFDLLVGVVDW